MHQVLLVAKNKNYLHRKINTGEHKIICTVWVLATWYFAKRLQFIARLRLQTTSSFVCRLGLIAFKAKKVTKIIISEKEKKKYEGSELLPFHNSIDIKITLTRPQSYFVELLLTRSIIAKYFLYFRFAERYQLIPFFFLLPFQKYLNFGSKM